MKQRLNFYLFIEEKFVSFFFSDFFRLLLPGFFFFLLACAGIVEKEFLVALVFFSFSLFFWGAYYWKKKYPAKVPPNPATKFRVEFNNETILYFEKEDTEPSQIILWKDLNKISITTNSLGPFEPDVFWVLETKTQKLEIPQGAIGEKELTNYLFGLPDFDYMVFLASMGCTSDMEFPCWELNDKPSIDFSILKKKVDEEKKENKEEKDNIEKEFEQLKEKYANNFEKEVNTSMFRTIAISILIPLTFLTLEINFGRIASMLFVVVVIVLGSYFFYKWDWNE